MTAEVVEHGHDHGPDDAPHEHGPEGQQQGPPQPQPVPMGIGVELVPMMDGSDRIQVTFQSFNGVWVAFFDRDGAIAHAQALLGMAYAPPVAPPEQTDGLVLVEPGEPSSEPVVEPQPVADAT